jgi:hypothetical protein
MEAKYWPHDDPVYARSLRARNAVLDLLEIVQTAKGNANRRVTAGPFWTFEIACGEAILPISS